MILEIIFRAAVLVVLVSALIISGTYRKRAREEGGTIHRREEGWTVLILRMGFALPLLVVILLNIFLPGAVSWAKFNLPLGFQIIGLILAIACIPVILWVFNSIGKNISETVLTKESHELVTSGPYSFVRHPLYGAALLLLFSISLVFRDWIILVYSLVGLVAFRMLVIPAEEKQLLDTFGEEYERYRNRTRSLFPWIW